MINTKLLSPFSLFVLVLISSLVLGLSLDNSRLIMIAYVGAGLGFFVSDVTGIFRLRGVLANIVSLLILVFAMKDFFPGDSTGKLISVANLLVYLQTVLMFQEKTTRLNWQILILSLLQVVVAAIFNFKFEAGLLFLVYFFVVTACLLIQCLHATREEVRDHNRSSANYLKNALTGWNSKKKKTERTYHGDRPLTFFESDPAPRTFRSMANHLSYWIAISLVFTTIMFAYVPRNAKSWFGPATIKVEPAGLFRSVNLDERGVIPQSAAMVFRAEVLKSDGEPIDLVADPPYFRGMALSSLKIEDNKTTWGAPHDRVFNGLYQSPLYAPKANKFAVQHITLEENDNPLVYGVMPFLKTEDNNASGVLFCHEVSALTRCKTGETIELSQFTYEAVTLLDENDRFSKMWPYLSNVRFLNNRPMSDDPPQEKWLTEIPSQRYPGIVRASRQVAEEVRKDNGTRMDLLKRMESYFLAPERFKYSLDFRNVTRDESLDPVEDFFVNHKQGHCELFASALTLMLREQGIPARFVVGFYGAEKNPISTQYRVKAKNAHAWVEAYLPPEDCTADMIAKGFAGEGGAWVLLDPTPPTSSPDPSVGEEAYDLARSVWDDYVIGSEGDIDPNSDKAQYALLAFLNSPKFRAWERRMMQMQELTNTSQFKFGLGGGIVLLIFLMWLKNRLLGGNTKIKKIGRLRRLFAGAISLISPGLGQWMIEGGGASRPTQFYKQMSRMLEPYGLTRGPSQTHREFATEVAGHFKQDQIADDVVQLTEWFNEVRFGQTTVDDDFKNGVDQRLDRLKETLASESFESADVA